LAFKWRFNRLLISPNVRFIKGILAVADELNIKVIAEGIEVEDEMKALQDLGIELMQGYYFAKPQIKTLTDPFNRT